MSETDISRLIRKALEKHGFWVERINSGKVRVHGGWMTLASPGTPDMLVVAPVYAWLETKTDLGKLNENQIAWHARAKRTGVPVETVRSEKEALQFVMRLRRALR